MGIKDSLKSLFTKKESVEYTSNKQFEILLDELISEGYYKNEYGSYISTSSLSKLKAYNSIKALDIEMKKELLFYLIEPIKKYEILSSKPGSHQSREHVWQKSYTYSELFNLLMRSNLDFSTDEIIKMINEFIESDKTKKRNFTDWPIGFTVQQIERIVKKNGLDDKLKTFLKGLLESPQFKLTKHYWGADIEKVRVKVEKIVFESENEEGRVAPYNLSDDRLAQIVNPQITNLKEELKDQWYALFHLFMKATGSKPTQKYLKTTSEIIDGIGLAKYKNSTHEWLSLCSSLKAVDTPREIKYPGGEVYNYVSSEYLHEKNLIFLKGLIWSMSKFHDSKTLSVIAKLTERCFEKVPGVGPTAAGVGNACIYTLGNTRGLEGISHLSRLKLKIKQNNTKKLIENYIESSSQKLGISTSEIEELSIPDFGLVDGFKSYAFDDYTLKIEIEALGKVQLSWIKPDGSIQKTAPSFIKESAKHKQVLKKAKETVAQIKKYLTAQRDRIDRLYLYDRIWIYDNFLKYYLNHGLVSFIAKDLIWNFKSDKKEVSATWREGKWKDVENNELQWVDSQTEVRLWHPINASVDEVLNWRNRLETLEVKQALKQAYREVYVLTDAEVNTKTYSNRMAAHLLKQHQFKALTGIRGWHYSLMGAYDDGRDGDIAKIALKEYNLEAQFWINEINVDDAFNDAGIWDYIATDQVRFIDSENEVKDLIEIPKIILSEIMRDVDLFVGVASVGNDPEWRDNGGLPQYRDYWTSYSFGELTEVAKTRKDILEKLVPRLKIGKVASFEGKFLKIKGKKRVYKIHIGSTNILMEPNDEYLCIVPARGKAVNTENVFLPFEGDRGLSLVLSKAFLLADDDKITDTTILSQINR
ncbi:DUF4132 domain-containing protein [Flavivirga rizhaonensis]|uniref:DUF4132 domain-containing protein n=1 Tax=Flavivirga rizhaonensis TaxID=2559571 RepID=A0A4S1E0H4_9FLAO|nr:DUF4132 domain-containing protein [Flavivirga rizhaonensis]TGV03398.1 DUF4132 domain-containing protein [Flavivirga rizhaonensis]